MIEKKDVAPVDFAERAYPPQGIFYRSVCIISGNIDETTGDFKQFVLKRLTSL
jgi:hypothetical protein